MKAPLDSCTCEYYRDYTEKISHFATFPTEIPRRCILAGTSDKGACPHCGAGWRRMTDREFVPQQDVRDPLKLAKASNKGLDTSNGWGATPRGTVESTTTGWAPTCACPHTEADLVPPIVLDPFAGAATTLLVANRLNRRALGLELNPEYVAMGRRRIVDDAPLFAGEIA